MAAAKHDEGRMIPYFPVLRYFFCSSHGRKIAQFSCCSFLLGVRWQTLSSFPNVYNDALCLLCGFLDALLLSHHLSVVLVCQYVFYICVLFSACATSRETAKSHDCNSHLKIQRSFGWKIMINHSPDASKPSRGTSQPVMTTDMHL